MCQAFFSLLLSGGLGSYCLALILAAHPYPQTTSSLSFFFKILSGFCFFYHPDLLLDLACQQQELCGYWDRGRLYKLGPVAGPSHVESIALGSNLTG